MHNQLRHGVEGCWEGYAQKNVTGRAARQLFFPFFRLLSFLFDGPLSLWGFPAVVAIDIGRFAVNHVHVKETRLSSRTMMAVAYINCKEYRK